MTQREQDAPTSASSRRLARPHLERLSNAIRRARGVAIDDYAPEVLSGVIAGALVREGVADETALAEQIEREPACADRFLASLWIGTTSLFRDPATFHAIRRDVVPRLRAQSSPHVWVAGCSTGEEVYSLAILLKDEGLLERTRIYATDVRAKALEVARGGAYPFRAIREGTRRYQASGGHASLCELYSADRERIAFAPALTANVVFATHDLATDGRFQDFDLILCRNVLIWFQPTLRDRSLELLRSSLRPEGTLALGRRENPRESPAGAAFERVVAGASLWRAPPDARWPATDGQANRNVPPSRGDPGESTSSMRPASEGQADFNSGGPGTDHPLALR